MSHLDPTLAVQNFVVHPDAKPIKHKLRKMHPRVALLVKEELERPLAAWLIIPIDDFDWISNIDPIQKKRVFH